MKTHTPGPWLAERINPSGGVLIEAGELYGGIIATVWETRPTQVSDAHLIAAAPDLYEALAYIERACEPGIDQSDDDLERFIVNVRRIARKALDKAAEG